MQAMLATFASTYFNMLRDNKAKSELETRNTIYWRQGTSKIILPSQRNAGVNYMLTCYISEILSQYTQTKIQSEQNHFFKEHS